MNRFYIDEHGIRRPLKLSQRRAKPRRRPHKTIPKKVGIVCYGALGDTILHYYRKGSVFGYIKAFKEKYPGRTIKVVCCSSNAQTSELFKENPYIDEVVHAPWATTKQRQRNDNIKKALHGYTNFEIGRPLPGAGWQEPQIYLDTKDKAFVDKIIQQGKYILVHPFASYPGVPLQAEEYPELIDTMIDELGYNVVVVGATYKRVFQEADLHKEEVFNYERKKLFNLVNKTNVRVAVRLARNAHGYLGTWSAFYCASWACPAGPMVFCTPNKASTVDLINKKRFPGAKYRKIFVPPIVQPILSQKDTTKNDKKGWQKKTKEVERERKKRRERIKKDIVQHLKKNG